MPRSRVPFFSSMVLNRQVSSRIHRLVRGELGHAHPGVPCRGRDERRRSAGGWGQAHDWRGVRRRAARAPRRARAPTRQQCGSVPARLAGPVDSPTGRKWPSPSCAVATSHGPLVTPAGSRIHSWGVVGEVSREPGSSGSTPVGWRMNRPALDGPATRTKNDSRPLSRALPNVGSCP